MAIVVLEWFVLVASAQDLGIVCANSILADLTRNIVGDLSAIEYIMPAGACPSHFDSRPSDANLVAYADVIIQIGWEGWLNKLIESTGNSDVLLIKTSGIEEWNIPEGAKAHVDAIAGALSKFFPEHASTFQANAAAYKAQIDAKGSELQARVESEGVAGSKVVCMEWQGKFVELLGFEIVAGYGPPEGLSVEESVNITSAALADDVCMIIDNLQSGTDLGSQVSAQTGVSRVILTNFPGALPNTDTYLDMIEYNAEKLIEDAQTYEYRSGARGRGQGPEIPEIALPLNHRGFPPSRHLLYRSFRESPGLKEGDRNGSSREGCCGRS